MMNFRCLLLLCLALAITPSLRAAAPPPEKLLPADTLGMVTAPNWDAAVAAFHQSSIGQLWTDPAMRSFKEKFQERFKAEVLNPLEKELGISPTNFSSLFHGQVTLAFAPAAAGRSSFLFFADSGAQSGQLATNLAAWRKKWTDSGKATKSTKIRDLDFVTLTVGSSAISGVFDKILPNPDPARSNPEAKPAPKNAEWILGQSGSLLLLSDSPKSLEKVLILQAGSGLPALADQPAFGSDAPHFRDSQVFAWVNLKSVFDRMAKSTGDAPAAEESLPMAHMLSLLGLTGVQTLAFNLQESAAGTQMNLRLRVPDTARQGLLKIFNLEAKDSSPPPFLPADAIKFSRTRLDLPKAWNNLEATLAEVSPQAAGVIKLVINTAGKLENPNFDLRESLLAKLGDDLIVYDKFPRSSAAKDYESPPSLILIGARNAEAVAAAMKAIADLLPPQANKYKEREFLGRTVYSFAWPASAAGGDGSGGATLLNYAANAGYVALSSDAALVEEFLRSSAGSGRSLREKAGLAEAAQRIGGMSTGFFSTDNISESARSFFATTRKDTFNAASLLAKSTLANRLGMSREGGLFSWFDFATLPPYERVAKYFHFDVSAISLTSEGYTYKLFAPAPPQLKK